MHISKALPIMASLASAATAQSDVVAPTMSLLYSMACDLGERFSLGPVPFGQERYVIPIIGGTFKGPKISGKHYQLSAYLQQLLNDHDTGKILNLGADWLLVDAHGNARPDTRYNLQADDGTYIYVQTEGPTQKDGRILLRGKFETSVNGTYSWLNDIVAVGVLSVNGSSQVLIDMWQVNP